MNGELAQRIALVSWGNEFLAGHSVGDVESTSTFQYVHSLRFTFEKRSRLRRTKATDRVLGWFEQLADRGVDRLELDCIGQLDGRSRQLLPAHVEVAFVGGEHSAIVAQRVRSTEVWRASWQSVAGNRPSDSRIWDVHYAGRLAPNRAELAHPSVSAATEILNESLVAAERFAREQDTAPWHDWFADARSLLSEIDPEIPYHPDLVPAGGGLDRLRLLAASIKAYAFGGMGSWNDLAFGGDTQTEYEEITRHLYQAVMNGLDAAVNASAGPRSGPGAS